MKKAIRTHARDFVALIAMLVIALGVGGYILSNQRLYLPEWVPFVGSDFVDRQLELTTAQSLTPGQGQEIDIAGVKVGEIGKVELKHGRAIVTMKIRRKHAQLYYDASALVRPKTGLNDMTIQLDPGTPKAGRAPADWAIPVSQTAPNVNPDELLASLDQDTRDYLQILLNAGAQGLHGRSGDLANTFRRFEPTSRDVLEITKLLAQRRENIKRSVGNFRLLTQAVAEKDDQLAQLVDSSNAVFQAFANQDRALRSTLQQLPGTLQVAQTNLGKADQLAKVLGPTLSDLRPAARSLGPSLAQMRPFLKESTPIIRDEIRPFARASLPTVKVLRPAAQDLATALPNLTTSFKVLNELLNTWAYNPPGDREEGYLFWGAWANHAAASLFASQDAHGSIRKGVILSSCSTLQTLPTIANANPLLGTAIQMLNLVGTDVACPKAASAGTGNPPSTTGAGTTPTAAGAGR